MRIPGAHTRQNEDYCGLNVKTELAEKRVSPARNKMLALARTHSPHNLGQQIAGCDARLPITAAEVTTEGSFDGTHNTILHTVYITQNARHAHTNQNALRRVHMVGLAERPQ